MLPLPTKGPDRFAPVGRDRVAQAAPRWVSSASSHEMPDELRRCPSVQPGASDTGCGRANACNSGSPRPCCTAIRGCKGGAGSPRERDRFAVPFTVTTQLHVSGQSRDRHRGHAGCRVGRHPIRSRAGAEAVAHRRSQGQDLDGRLRDKSFTLSGSACSLRPSRIADRLGRGRSRT